MRKKFPLAYFFIFFIVLGLMSLPKESSEKLRGSTIAMLAPTWHHLLAVKSFIFRSTNIQKTSPASHSEEEIQKLRIENTLLKTEIAHLKEIMQKEMQILSQLSIKDQNTQQTVQQIRKRHKLELQKLLQLQLQAIPAKIIFRSPASWNSSVWIDVGHATNQAIGITTIAKNSPVVIGNCVIGVVDYVGEKQSRVRLITDSGLTPSVRALRNETPTEKGSTENEPTYLAKGEIYGASKPLWRAQRHLLKGTGFNYDFADGDGLARDLRTGKPIDGDNEEDMAIPLLKTGDILVTTGLDGVFPRDLFVAEVTKVHPLKEGDYFYDLDALPAAGNLDDVNLVFVIPSLGYDEEDQPNSFDF